MTTTDRPAEAPADPWVSLPWAAQQLGVSVRSLQAIMSRGPEAAEAAWGRDAQGRPRWRRKPVVERQTWQVRASAVEARMYG